MLGLDEPWIVWQFDNAIFQWGRYVNGKLRETDKKGKSKYKLEDVLEGRAEPKRGTLQDLMLMFGSLVDEPPQQIAPQVLSAQAPVQVADTKERTC